MPRRLIVFILALLLLPRAALADYAAGERAYDQHQWINAIAELRPLADAGDDRAAFLLGKMYIDGNGVVPNAPEAMRLYRLSAAKGNANAMISIAAIYQAGLGYRPNVKLANAWFARAAASGSQLAAYLYAISLFEGDTTRKTDLAPDPAAAYKWFKIAAVGNNYPKVRDAAAEAAQVASARLKPVEITQLDKDAAAFKPSDDLGPMPEETKE